MWRPILPYVVLALMGLASLSLLIMLVAIFRTFGLKHSSEALRRRRRSVSLWAFNSLVLIAALVAGGLLMVPRTTRLDLVPTHPVVPARPTPAVMSPARLWSLLVGDFIPYPAVTAPVMAEPRTQTPPARPAPPPPPPAVKKTTPPAVKNTAPPVAAPGLGLGWTELLAGLTLPRPQPATTPPEPPKVVLPSTDPEAPPVQVPPPPTAAPATPTPAAPTPPSARPILPPGPRSTPPTVGVAPAAPRLAPTAPRPEVKPTPPPPAAGMKPHRVPKRCWALSTDSFRTRDRAIYTLRQRRKLGLKPHPISRVRVKGKLWYRVIVGCFSTRQAAQRYARRLHKNGLTRDQAQVLLRPNPEARGHP
jgi:hypothetical protein